jgi:hypothetical protein
MWQQILVAVIVIAACAASVWKLMPARRRLVSLMAVDRWAARHERLAGWRVTSLQPRIARAAASGCAGCAANTHPPDPPRGPPGS